MSLSNRLILLASSDFPGNFTCIFLIYTYSENHTTYIADPASYLLFCFFVKVSSNFASTLKQMHRALTKKAVAEKL